MFPNPSQETLRKGARLLLPHGWRATWEAQQGWECKRYTLFVTSQIVEGRYGRASGTVTDYVNMQISTNDLGFLLAFWKKDETAQMYATTCWHFIWDNVNDQLERVLSCA